MSARKKVKNMLRDTYTPNYLEVNRKVLEQNAKAVVDYLDTEVIAVVKFDGYGMTIVEAARAWQKAGVRKFAVSESWEALALRQAGFTEDILLTIPVMEPQTFKELLRNNIILMVSDLDNARFYQENRGDTVVRVHVKVDTGMGRFGVHWTDIAQLKAIYGLEGFSFEGIYSHFGKSFEKTYDKTKQQMDRFMGVLDALKAAGIEVGMRHIANSCAALRFPETRLDAVRIGSALVGSLIAESPVPLSSPGVFKAQVVGVRKIWKGDTMGYASVYKAKKDMTVAVVAVGEESGFAMTCIPEPLPLRDFVSYLRSVLSRYLNPPFVTFGDQKLPMVGRIGSRHTSFDATGTNVKVGDYVNVKIHLTQCVGERKFI